MYPIEEARQTLWSRDFAGYSFEMGNSEVLKKHGFSKHVIYRNPKKPRLWKKKKGVGVDKILEVGYYRFYVEESFCGSDYHYRRSWFEKCRLPRFEHYPNDELHRHIVLTNKPDNFSSVKDLAKRHGIQIMSIDGLLALIRSSTRPPDFVLRSLSVDGMLDSSLASSVVNGMNSSYDKQTNNTSNNVYAYDKLQLETRTNRLVRDILNLARQTKQQSRQEYKAYGYWAIPKN